jgi:hypothetical protein
MPFNMAHPIDDLWTIPRFYVEPRDRGLASETQRQATLLGLVDQFAPTVAAWSTPNEGRRSRWERGHLLQSGLNAGAPDLNFVWSAGDAFIEMKSGKGVLTNDQIFFCNKIHELGHCVACFRDPMRAFLWLVQHCRMPVKGMPQ